MPNGSGPSMWDRMTAWNIVLPPSRPSATELGVIRRWLTRMPGDASIAILGSTPEFRNLAAMMGKSRVTVIDRNPAFHASVEPLLTFDPGHFEEVIFERWQDHFAGVPRYDAVLSDLTLGNVPYEDRQPFYAALWASLAPGGVFIDKVLTNEGQRYTFERLRSLFEWLPFNLRTVNDFNCAAVFCSIASLSEPGILVAERVYTALHQGLAESPALVKLTEACKTITPSSMSWYYGLDWYRVRMDYIPAVPAEIHDQEIGSPYHSHARQFVFRKEGGNGEP